MTFEKKLPSWAESWKELDSNERTEPDEETEKVKEQLIEWAERIEQANCSIYINAYNFIEPNGVNGRNLEEERAMFFQNLDDPTYVPQFTYPKLEHDFDAPLERLTELQNQLTEEKNERVRKVISDTLETLIAKVQFLKAAKDGNDDQTFEFAKQAYGDITPELVSGAEKLYSEFAEKSEGNKSKTETYLENASNTPTEIKEVFDEGLKIMGLENWEIVLDPKKTMVSTEYSSQEYNKPSIVVPAKRARNSLDVLLLLAHEIGTHARTNENNARAGLQGISFGKDYETLQEGIALYAEQLFMRELLGKEKPIAEPFFVMAMGKAQQGANFREVFEYMKQNFLRYFDEVDTIREAEGRSMQFSSPEKKLETADDRAWRTSLRIFRGFHHLSRGGKYFPKDKAYFEGGFHAETLAEHGLTDYLTKFKVDPALVDSFHQWGMEAINPVQVKQVAEKFFKDEIKWFFK